MGIKYAVNETFFETWSDEMAYILGFWFADGSIENARKIRGKYIRIGSTDKKIIETIRNKMHSQHKIILNQKERKKIYYMLRIGNKELFKSIKKLGITERKSLITRTPEIPARYINSFVRGYFDGDGCVHLEKNDKSVKRMTTIFTSGSRKFLTDLQKLLSNQAGMSSGVKIHTTRGISNAFQLRYSTRDSIRLFQFMYPKGRIKDLYLERKYAIFKKYFKERDLTQSDFSVILKQQGPVVKG